MPTLNEQKYRSPNDWAKLISEKMSDQEYLDFVNYLESNDLLDFWSACEEELQRRMPGIDR